MARIQDAWNRADLKAYAACYAEDAGYVGRSGQLVTGRAEIERVHREALSGALKGTSLRVLPLRMQELSPSIAVVHAEIELTGATTVWAVSTFVVRDDLIVAAQTTEV
jgi:uncharacterized protein (TIGR02246 family)